MDYWYKQLSTLRLYTALMLVLALGAPRWGVAADDQQPFTQWVHLELVAKFSGNETMVSTKWKANARMFFNRHEKLSSEECLCGSPIPTFCYMGDSVTDPRPVVVDVPTVAEQLQCEQREERDQIALYCNKFANKDACKWLPLDKRISCTTGYVACLKNYCGIWCLNTEISKLEFQALNTIGHYKNNGLRLSVPNLALTTLFALLLLIM